MTAFTDLRWNNIGLLGGRSLLEALQKNKRVVHLEMAGNNIPSDTLRALGEFVRGSFVLITYKSAFYSKKGQFVYSTSVTFNCKEFDYSLKITSNTQTQMHVDTKLFMF